MYYANNMAFTKRKRKVILYDKIKEETKLKTKVIEKENAFFLFPLIIYLTGVEEY